MAGLVYLNGELVPEDQAAVSVFDHGLLYGDGVFEGIRAYNGRVFKLREHIDRLYRSAHCIMLEIPLSKQEMADAVVQTVRANGLRDAYIRLVVTRGAGDLGLDPRKCSKPTIFIIASSITLYPEEFYENGLKLITCCTRRNISEAIDPTLKSLNYLNNILAKIETIRAGVPEGLMLNADGYVAECTGDNIFIVNGGRVITPPVHVGALEGITRGVVMELARAEGLEVAEEMFRLPAVYTADECFLTGTAAEVVPVSEVDGRKIGDGRPGPITQLLRRRFAEYVRSEGVPVYE
ncbi:MAG: branched-chain-amino-acid transaminase [Armatimonadetes bacterium]|nr:branched-chain-amino-acid transaminase [Armatimonadota bacterium]